MMRTPPNLFADLPGRSPEEAVESLLSRPGIRVERIVSHGHASPEGFWYDQAEHEWVVLLSGSARLRFEDEAEPVELSPGSHVNIAAHRRHRVEWTAPDQATIWLAVFYGDEKQ